MKFNYDLSMLVPGVRPEHWNTLYEHMGYGCKRFSWELIFCGPKPLPPELQDKPNVKYIKDMGTPTRSLQIASMLAEGRFISWMSDDSHIYNDSIDRSIDILFQNNPDKDAVGLRYCEGAGFSGNINSHPHHYSFVSTHPDLQAPNVDKSWAAPAIALLSNEYYRYLGGIDCRFEHINLNLIDLMYRMQMNGSKVIIPLFLTFNCNWEPTRTRDNSPIIQAFFENDRPLYWQIYSSIDPRPIRIDPEGWRNTDVVWQRKLKFNG